MTGTPLQWINLAVFLTLSVLLVLQVFATRFRFRARLYLMMLLSPAVWFCFYEWGEYLLRFIDFTSGLADSMRGRLAIASLVICGGIFAHWFKQKDPLRYGQVEVLVASCSAVNIASGMDAKEALFSKWVALAGLAYFVARGLNNWSDALDKQSERYGFRSIREHVLSWIFEEHSMKSGHSA